MKQELKEEYKKDFKKVKSALLEIISNSRNISTDIAKNLAEEDYSLLEEYGVLTKNIIDASKQFNDLYINAPKIISEIEKIKESKKKINLEDLSNLED